MIANNVIHFVLVNCQWGKWTATKCSSTCGNSFRTISRKVLTKPAYGGLPCSGNSTITEKCDVASCPGSTIDKDYHKYMTVLIFAAL